MRIIVAIDIMGGKCVRLTKGDFSTKKIYNEDPLAVAREIEESGLEYLHLVDLDGARNKKVTNYRILEKIARNTSLKIDFGGGIRTDEDLKISFGNGARQVTCGSVAVTDPTLFLEWLEKWGAERIILGADTRDRRVSAGGWLEDSDTEITSFIRNYHSKGVLYTICTDIQKDGMLEGPSINLYKEILGIRGLNLIASGGISSIEDINELNKIGCEGAIIGKAVYEGRITLKELCRLC
ncbi:MAG: 1-(5-phosphoribosyl)-5-[(5-phosphoribosylamino)methylideneamino]imidazole-4-carboxamide isomerase [Bacteroidales bacterium]